MSEHLTDEKQLLRMFLTPRRITLDHVFELGQYFRKGCAGFQSSPILLRM